MRVNDVEEVAQVRDAQPRPRLDQAAHQDMKVDAHPCPVACSPPARHVRVEPGDAVEGSVQKRRRVGVGDESKRLSVDINQDALDIGSAPIQVASRLDGRAAFQIAIDSSVNCAQIALWIVRECALCLCSHPLFLIGCIVLHSPVNCSGPAHSHDMSRYDGEHVRGPAAEHVPAYAPAPASIHVWVQRAVEDHHGMPHGEAFQPSSQLELCLPALCYP